MVGMQRKKIRDASRPPSRPEVATRKRAMEDECAGIKKKQGSKPGESKKKTIIPLRSIGTNVKLYWSSACVVVIILPLPPSATELSDQFSSVH